MRRLFVALLALIFLSGGSASVAMAQADATPAADEDAAPAKSAGGDSAFAKGLDAPATYFSDRGKPIATLTVTDVERGWQDYGKYSEPDPGVEYVAVTFEVAAVSKSNLVVKAYDFSLLDSLGHNNSRSYVSMDEGATTQLLEDDTAVASGETTEFTVVFELYEDTDLGFFMWQADRGVIVMVDLSEV